MITLTVVKNITGPKTYLFKDEESYIVATSEMEGSHVLPRYARSLANELQKVLHGVDKRRIVNEIQPNSAYGTP